MQSVMLILGLSLLSVSSAVIHVKNGHTQEACAAEDLKRRAQLQNKLADACEDMCKNVGSYPNCNCPNFVQPDSTPGVMTWDELLEHMDNLSSWGADELKAWRQQASALQKSQHMIRKAEAGQTAQACAAEDVKRRTQVQNKLADACEDMCKNVGSYPNCNCPNFVQPDSTPGVMTWDELLEHMDNLSSWGADELKAWRQQASALQKGERNVVRAKSSANLQACATEDVKRRAQLQNKLADACEDMCKNVGSYPNCNCPNFVQPDSTPGVMTWDELLEHMDNLSSWGADELKAWRQQASALQKSEHAIAKAEAGQTAKSCAAEDVKRRAQVQNKLADACEDMCKNVGSYPNCNCPNFVQPDSTPGVMTWDELLEHMDNLSSWGADELKAWRQQASALQKGKHAVVQAKSNDNAQACATEDVKRRAQLQNKLADACEDMCKNVGSYPNCNCPNFVQPDSTPGVMTWDELLEHMDNLSSWGADELKAWRQQASALQKSKLIKRS